MILSALLIQAAPSVSTVGLIVAVSFFLVFLAVAFVAYKALKKTAKMAFRMMVVSIILVIAVVGSLSLWYFSAGGTPKLKPPLERKR
ncbi:MAG: hypothetical protein WKF92_09735 [Pyrinomonadaceae bacterium]